MGSLWSVGDDLKEEAFSSIVYCKKQSFANNRKVLVVYLIGFHDKLLCSNIFFIVAKIFIKF